MKTARTVAVLVVAALLLAALPASGQIPTKMNYQVMLTDGADQPLENEPVQLIFRIYDDPNVGSLKWTETHNPTTNSVGVVSVILGSSTPLTIAFDEPLWLEVEVDTEILLPRRELVSSPYALHAVDSDYLGGELAGEYALAADLSVAGTINQPANPVDWTKLKGVPAGFADGVDDAGGTGDGYSLDADDGSPVDAVYVDSAGDVGIGVTNPSNRVQIHRPAAMANYLQFTDIATGTTSIDGFEVGTNGSGYALLNQQENLSLDFYTNDTFRGRFDADGTFELGNSSYDGRLEVWANGSAFPTVVAYDHTDGGAIELKDNAGITHTILEPDVSGGGAGFFMVTNGTPFEGVWIEGNEGDGEAVLVVSGAASYTEFDASLSGNDSVQLPQDAINDYEILDEPGAGSDTGYPGVALDLTGNIDVMASAAITAPSDGYALVIGSLQANLTHTETLVTYADFGVSNVSDAFSDSQELPAEISSAAPSGSYGFPVTSHAIFPVSAGSNTFYFLGDEGGGTVTVNDVHLSVVFIPSAYGTIEDPTPPAMASRSSEDVPATAMPLTAADIEVERARSEADYRARVDAELSEMEAQIAEIRARLAEQLNN
jgi:hypothetical protein